MKTWNRFALGSLAVPTAWLGAALVLCQPVEAQITPQPIYTVNSLTDAHDAHTGDGICAAADGTCTLRAAIEENEVTKQSAQVLIPPGTVTLTLGELDVSTSLSLQGKGNYSTFIDAGHHRGFTIQGAQPFNVSMADLDIMNGYFENGIGSGTGGGISIGSTANVSLGRVRLTGNSAQWAGAGIYNSGYLTISDCAFSGNFLPQSDGSGVTGSGAGIYNDPDATLIVNQTTFSGNTGTRGGGVFNTGVMTMQNCTLTGNKVSQRGGAIFNEGSPKDNADISYSTIVENQAGIPTNNGSRPSVTDMNGGGIYNDGLLFMGKSILALNTEPKTHTTANYSPDCYSGPDERVPAIPTFISHRDNIIGILFPQSCNIQDQNLGAPPLDLYGTWDAPIDPLLLVSSDNGGTGFTREPQAGSPAITHAVKGLGGLPPCPSVDQHGAPRPVQNNAATGEGCTVGAFQIASNTGVIEAENAMRLGGDFYQVIDAAASANAYLWTDDRSINHPDAIDPSSYIRFTFYVDVPGEYKFQGTVRTPSTDHNSFWYRIDGYPDAGSIWDLPVSPANFTTSFISERGKGTEGNPQTPVLTTFFGRGIHFVDIFVRENQAQLDKLEMINVPIVALNIEMETAAKSGAFQIGFDPAASLGKYVFTPPGVNFLSAINPAHSVSTVVNAPVAGTYLIKANVRAQSDAHNSFWVKVDGLPANGYLWDMTEDNLNYGPDYVSDRGNGDHANPQFDAVELNLAAGPHTIEVFAREEGTRLDKLGLELKSDADARIVSRNKTYYSSSNESNSYLPANAFDGTTSTRWSSQASDNQWVKVDLGATYDIDRVVLDWEAAFAEEYQIQISNDAENWNTLYHKDANTGGIDNIMLSGRGRYVRMLGVHRGTQYGYSLREFSVYGAPAVGGDVNLCAGKTVTTSSNQDGTVTGDKAVDQNLSSRWSSNFSDDQWIYVDLGVKRDINRVKLRWESAFGKSYEIRVSDDASNWTTIFSTTNGNGNLDDLSVSGSGRYVKMRGSQRGTAYGYSLYEFEAYGQ